MNPKIKEYIPYIIIIIVVITIRTFFFTPIMVNGTSMQPTLKGNEIMILNKIMLKTSALKRYQIVVVKEGKSHLIKRIIGMPGETIKCVEGIIYINDKKLNDSYGTGVTYDFESIKIPKDNYFIMGDNRVVSNDSRNIGPISKSELKGTTNIIIFPFSKIGSVK